MNIYYALSLLITLCTVMHWKRPFKSSIIWNMGHFTNTQKEAASCSDWGNWSFFFFSFGTLKSQCVLHLRSSLSLVYSMPVSGLHCVLVPYWSLPCPGSSWRSGWWEPEPCPLWIRTLCQSNPLWGLNKQVLCHLTQCLGWGPTCRQCYNADIKGRLWIP